MKSILIRGGMSPFDPIDAPRMAVYNTIGNNNGNLLYAFSVARCICTDEEMTIDADYYVPESRIMTDAEIDLINQKYDLYVIPLANAFRKKFMIALKRLTNFINRIKIPVILVGIGVGKKHGDPKHENEEIIKNFFKAVLNKSAMVGVRGEITRDYLVSLGLTAEKDVTAIGCPSAYTFGPTMSVHDPKLSRGSKVLINYNPAEPDNVHEFFKATAVRQPNFYLMQQMRNELMEIYLGAVYNLPKTVEKRKRFFLDVTSWIDFSSDAELSIGSRLHGNVITTLAGVPSIFIPIDFRMEELIAYHHYPHVKPEELSGRTSIRKLVSKLDFHEFEKYQDQNFAHYLDFYKANGVPTIYDGGTIPGRKDAPFDQKLKKAKKPEGMVLPAICCTKEERKKRWDLYEAEMRTTQTPIRNRLIAGAALKKPKAK